MLDAWAHGGRTTARLGPSSEQRAETRINRREITAGLLHFGGLPRDQRAHFATRSPAGTANGHDVANLSEREPDAARLRDEPEDAEGVVAVQAIAAGGAGDRLQDPYRLVDTQRLARRSRALHEFATRKPVRSMPTTLNPAPGGRVKWITRLQLQVTTSHTSSPSACWAAD